MHSTPFRMSVSIIVILGVFCKAHFKSLRMHDTTENLPLAALYERMAIKRKVVADGLAKNQPRLGDAMDILCKVGGYDHAGLAGMILAGARRRIPTMVDGVNATAAALLAYGLEPACADYMLCSHLSAEISHAKMLEVLRLTPIVDAGMRLGEGTGASLAIVILQMAINTYKELYKRGGMHA